MSTQLTLVCHAATAATRDVTFSRDDALPASSREKASARAAAIRRVDAAWVSPARAARETAAALGLAPTTDPALRDLDIATWSGRTLAGIDPADLAAWLTDPGAKPHGGESIAALIDRTATWLASLDPAKPRVVAVTHASVLRAALVAALATPPAAFWRIDVAPLCRLRLNGSGNVWTLRSIGPL